MLARLRASRAVYPLAIASILAAGLWLGTARQYLSFDNPKIDIVRLQEIDVDYQKLYPAIESKATFLQTFHWWHEPWREDQWVAAYWRPLTMQAWWLQSHLFGEDRSYNWMRLSLVLTVGLALLFTELMRRLTGRRLVALLGLALFALPAHWTNSLTPLSAQPRIWNIDLLICDGWKDQPDLFANCLILGAMVCALRNRLGLALACAGVAIGFKESGMMAFPLVALIATSQRGVRSIPWWCYAGGAGIMGVVMICRWFAGPLVFAFHTYGRNVSGLTRFGNAMLPVGFTAFSSWGQTLLALGMFGLLLWRPKRPLVWAAILLGAFGTAVGLVAWQEQLSWEVALANLLLVGTLPALLLLAWLCIGWVLWTQKQQFRWALILAACSYLAAIPFAMATQTADHVLTLARAFQAGYGACVVLAFAAALRLWIGRVKLPSVKRGPETVPATVLSAKIELELAEPLAAEEEATTALQL